MYAVRDVPIVTTRMSARFKICAVRVAMLPTGHINSHPLRY